MTEDIISRKLSNDRAYAYHAGAFWAWDEDRQAWKESALLTKQYGLNRDVDQSLTPEDFLSDPSRFRPLEDYEVDCIMRQALREARPDRKEETAPAVPEQEPDAPAEVPEFDYSGLDAKAAADLHTAEDEYRHGKKLAERGLIRMGEAVAIAHDVLVAQCGGHNNQHSDDSFRAWCGSIGISKDTAYRLLQVSALIEGSTSRQKQVLESLPQTLLYAVAKPSAPAQLVEQVKAGDITTNKQYQEALAKLKAERERAEAAEAQLEAVTADVQGLAAENEKLEKRVDQAEQECMDRGTECLQAVARAAKAEDRARKAEDALKHQPITAVVDEEEMDRRAHQQAYSIAADMTGELRAKNEELTRQLDAAKAAGGGDPETDLATACSCLTSVMGMWSVALPAMARLRGAAYRTAADYAREAAESILRDLDGLGDPEQGGDGQ